MKGGVVIAAKGRVYLDMDLRGGLVSFALWDGILDDVLGHVIPSLGSIVLPVTRIRG